MKILTVVILLSFGSVALCNAQTGSASRFSTRVTQLRAPQADPLPFTVRLPAKNRLVFDNDLLHSFQGELINNTDSTLTVGFQRLQSLPNSDWTTSICFGTTCYPSSVDSKTSQIGAHDSVLLVLDVTNSVGRKSDSAVTFLKLYAVDGNEADTALLQFNSVFQPAKGVANAAAGSSLGIERVWPNPAAQDGTLHLTVTAPETSVAQAVNAAFVSIISPGGVTLSTTSIGRLTPGPNQVTLNAKSLAAGCYFLQVITSSGSSNLYGVTIE